LEDHHQAGLPEEVEEVDMKFQVELAEAVKEGE
jgi:hypothetical protein